MCLKVDHIYLSIIHHSKICRIVSKMYFNDVKVISYLLYFRISNGYGNFGSLIKQIKDDVRSTLS